MIRVLHKAFDILDLLSGRPEQAVGLGEIAGRLGLNAATCANILKTLIHRGLVEQEAPKKGYRLGGALYFLTRHGPYRRDLIAPAEPVVARLGAELAETALLATLSHGKRYILCVAHGSPAIRVRLDQPYRNDVYETATGRVLLAHQPAGEVERLLAAHGAPGRSWPEAADAAALREALARIREQGRHVTTDVPELVQAGWPVREAGRVVAALGVALPAMRYEGEHRDAILRAGERASAELTEKLTARAAGGPATKAAAAEGVAK